MPRTCTICTHPEREDINKALVAGEPLRTIVSRYGTVGRMALQRHKDDHLPAVMVKAEHAKEVTQADDLIGQLQEIVERTHRLYRIADGIIGKAVAEEDWRTALMAVREASTANREARANLELLAEMLGELKRNPIVNIHLSAEWIQVRALLMGALADYPEARASVAAVLLEADRVHA